MESLVSKPEVVIIEWLTGWEKKFSEQWGFDVKIKFFREHGGGAAEDENFVAIIKNGGQIPFGSYVNIQLKKAETQEYEESNGAQILYSVQCSTYAALCGTMVFTYVNRYSRIKLPSPKNSSLLFIEFIKDYAAARNYSNVSCSNVVPKLTEKIDYAIYPTDLKAVALLKAHGHWHGFKFKQNLLRAGFNVSTEFLNKRTNHLINIFNINL